MFLCIIDLSFFTEGNYFTNSRKSIQICFGNANNPFYNGRSAYPVNKADKTSEKSCRGDIFSRGKFYTDGCQYASNRYQGDRRRTGPKN